MSDTKDAKAEYFLEGLSLVLIDLEKASSRDPEAVMLIGSLVDRLNRDAGKTTWPEVKKSLSDSEHTSLIGTFARQIDAAQAEGNIKIAYALQALATSLVGSRFEDARVEPGVALLDDFIASAQKFFNGSPPKPN